MRLLVACGVVTMALGQAPPPAAPTRVIPQAKAYRWSADDRPALTKLFSSESVVRQFLSEIVEEGAVVEPGLIAKVKEYRLVDMYGDGSIELVALVDTSGRDYYGIDVVDKDHDEGRHKPKAAEFDGFAIRDIPGDVESLDSALKDLDGDGVPEVVVWGQLDRACSGSGVHPCAGIPEVFQWNGYQFALAWTKFRWYYTQVVIPELEDHAKWLAALPESSADEQAMRQEEKAANAASLTEARRRSSRQ